MARDFIVYGTVKLYMYLYILDMIRFVVLVNYLQNRLLPVLKENTVGGILLGAITALDLILVGMLLEVSTV
jgi:hypothetical protein